MSSQPDDSVPSILRTGSMLNLAADIVENAPQRLGPYRILERIGEGGMGIVYLAEQDPPLIRRVAIKLARSGVSGDRALARFESERQTLATMNHPNIARVFDAGSSTDGRPYFVMEWVAGESIIECCDRRQLGIEERLELLCRVCDGVQHAHLNAVIHRDLKPSNILVTTEGGPASPKIIDFGVAKALDSGVGAVHRLTQAGQLLGTPEYMSPEQAALDGRPVDTRTDVYSLGVVLYELLTGERPFERGAEPDASLAELCHRIREQEPEPPNVRATRGSSAIAVRRSCASSRELARTLRGDLDAITLKALSKDPKNRYATSSELAADLERYLHDRPIEARRPGPIVRLRKAFRRHRTAVVVTAALSVALIAFGIVGVVQAVRAARETARAEAESQLATEIRDFLLGAIDPPGPLITGARHAGLFEGANQEALLQHMRERFADRPILLAQLLLAEGNRRAASRGDARDFEVLTEARERIIASLGADSPLALATSERLARTCIYLRRYPEAEAFLRDTLERRRSADPEHPDTLRTTALFASLYKQWQKHDRAAPLFESAIAGLERHLPPDDPDLLSSMVGLSGSYLDLRRYGDAEALLTRGIDRIRRVFGERDYQTRVAFYNLACAHANSGHTEEAFRYLKEAIELGVGIFPGRDPQLLPLHRDSRFAGLDRMARLNAPDIWPSVWFEADSRYREGRFDDAEPLLKDLIAAVERVEGRGTSNKASQAMWTLAKCWIARGRFDDAEPLLLETLAVARRDGDLEDERRTLEVLAQCEIGRGDTESALARIAAAAALHHPFFHHAETHYSQAETEALQGRYETAMASLAQASEMGLDDVARLTRDLAFAKLRTRAEFRRIVEEARRRGL